MIVINCLFKSEKTDMNDFFKVLVERGLVEGSRADKGNHGYDFYISAEDPKKMMLVETWESKEDLQAHSSTDLFKTFAPTCKEFAVLPKISMYQE